MFIGKSSENRKIGQVSYSKNDVEYISEVAYTRKFIHIFFIKIKYDERELDAQIQFPEDKKKSNGVGFKSTNHVGKD